MTPRLGLFGARADRGGLASLTWEFWRHVQPERTMVIDLGNLGRGPTAPDMYAMEGYTFTHLPVSQRTDTQWVQAHAGMDNFTDAEMDRWLDGLDVVWCVEVDYGADLFRRCRERGITTIGMAMPELRTPAFAPDILLNPTSYLMDRMPDARILPVPVALDHYEPRRVTKVDRLFALGCHAFHDRDGLNVVVDALRHVTVPCTLVIRQVAVPEARRLHLPAEIGCVSVEWDNRDVAEHWRTIPDDVDALVMPRRFGGLSLPMAEAAARGLPIISSHLPPQSWISTSLLVDSVGRSQVNAAGGFIDVHDFDPRDVANRIDTLVTSGGSSVRTEFVSGVNRAWAEANSWDRLLPDYRALIEEAAGA